MEKNIAEAPVENQTASVKDSSEKQTNEVCSKTSKTSEETETRYNRLKLFDKVMQKSLEKFVELAR